MNNALRVVGGVWGGETTLNTPISQLVAGAKLFKLLLTTTKYSEISPKTGIGLWLLAMVPATLILEVAMNCHGHLCGASPLSPWANFWIGTDINYAEKVRIPRRLRRDPSWSSGRNLCPYSKNMKSKLWFLFVLAYCVYGMVLTIGSLAGFPENLADGYIFPYLADKPVGEDGYYMLTVAWHLAEGRGLVYNYDIPTTGIQPLVTYLFGGIAWLVQSLGGDKWVFIRSILAFGIILLPIFAHLIGRLSAQLAHDPMIKKRAYLIGFVLTLFNIELFRWFTYGLETGVYLILMALTILKFADLSREAAIPKYIELGILVGITCLARIDFIVIFLLYLLFAIIYDNTKFVSYFMLGITAFGVVVPWFFYVFTITGKWIPSSGGAQASFLSSEIIGIGGRILASSISILAYIFPWVMSQLHLILFFGTIVLTGIFIFWLLKQKNVGKALCLRLKQKPMMTAWLMSIPILVVIYPIFFWAWHFYPRYFAPITIPYYIILAVLIAERLRSAPKWSYSIIYTITPALFFFWAIILFHNRTITNTFPLTTSYIQQHFSAVKVGALQSGEVGFFNPNVINLDGKINHEALIYSQNNALHHYIDKENINIMVDWSSYFERYLDEEWLDENWDICPQTVPDDVATCLMRKQP